MKRKTPPQVNQVAGLDKQKALDAVHVFLEECRKRYDSDSLTAYGSFLCSEYRRVFQAEPPNAMLCLIKDKIAYRLQYIGWKSAGKVLSPAFMKNYEASQRLDPSGFGSDAKVLMKLSMKAESERKGKQEEPIMKVVKKKEEADAKKVAAKESPKKGAVTRSWIELLEQQPKAKRSDEALAVEMRKRHPEKKKYTVEDVAAVRSLFNRGKLNGQAKKPAVALEAFGVKK